VYKRQTIIGGLLATLLLAGLDDRRERKRRRERHATAVRIVVLELAGIGAAHAMHTTGAPFSPASRAGYDTLAADLYSLLPQDLASDLAFVYGHAGDPGSPAGAKLVAEKVIGVLNALRGYGERELGLIFQVTGQSQRWAGDQKQDAQSRDV